MPINRRFSPPPPDPAPEEGPPTLEQVEAAIAETRAAIAEARETHADLDRQIRLCMSRISNLRRYRDRLLV